MFIIGLPDQDPYKLEEKEECEGFKILSNNIVFPRASFSWDRKHPLVNQPFHFVRFPTIIAKVWVGPFGQLP